jgi:hypothetical protein
MVAQTRVFGVDAVLLRSGSEDSGGFELLFDIALSAYLAMSVGHEIEAVGDAM